jgi:outer membrane PBP1 activator LpoA protein
MKSFTNILLIASLSVALLAGCSNKATKSTSTTEKIRPEVLSHELSAESLIHKANLTSDTRTKALLLLDAAEKLLQNNMAHRSSNTLFEIDDSEFYASQSTQNYYRLLLLHLKLGIYENYSEHLTNALRLFRPTVLEKINVHELNEIIPLLTEALYLEDRPLEGAILLMEYSGILATHQLTSIHEQIWTLLRETKASQLNNFRYEGNDKDAGAWLELIQLITLHQIDLDSQYRALKNWQSKWPNHPATIHPPAELRLLSELPSIRPRSITLALPFTGPVEQVGKAVRDGFMAAYYNAYTTLYNPSSTTPSTKLDDSQQHPRENALSINFFDTNIHSIDSLFANPPEKNNLIVGPLTKSEVNKLSSIDLHATPVLALNYLDTSAQNQTTTNTTSLYQFGLNPDIEVAQLARILAQRNHHKIAYIGPENDLGFRLFDALTIELQHHDSIIIESIFYKEQRSLSQSVAKLLGTDQSKIRERTVQNITGIDVEFEPRRRQDIDAIFMLAKPQVAKQLNPLFAYHYAGDLPIYSGSQIHQIDEPKNDLDNIIFVDMPWMLSNTIDIKNTIEKAIPSSASQYARFYALGADAFSLAPRLEILRTVKGSQLQGQTGRLSINPAGIIERELEIAVFRNGRANIIKE